MRRMGWINIWTARSVITAKEIEVGSVWNFERLAVSNFDWYLSFFQRINMPQITLRGNLHRCDRNSYDHDMCGFGSCFLFAPLKGQLEHNISAELISLSRASGNQSHEERFYVNVASNHRNSRPAQKVRSKHYDEINRSRSIGRHLWLIDDITGVWWPDVFPWNVFFHTTSCFKTCPVKKI